MESSNLTRWGALSAMAGGVLFTALFAMGLLVESQVLGGAFFQSHWGYHSLDVPVNVLLAAGVLGLYGWQKPYFGMLGKVGTFLACGGFALTTLGGLAIIGVELAVAEGATPEWLDMVTHMLAALLSTIGVGIFGVATLRSKVAPREGAFLLMAGSLMFLGMLLTGAQGSLLMVPAAFVGGGFAWSGYALLSQVSASAGETTHAAA